MAVTFHKMHGLGNDFVLLDLRHQDFKIDKETAQRLANRHTGIGCDQILVLRKPHNEQQLASFEFWNADGSRAEQCGNGVRAMGFYLHQQSETPAGSFLLGGPAGVVSIECLDNGLVRVDMGKPEFHADKVPVLLDLIDDWYPLNINQKDYHLGAVSMGNPHCLMVVDDIDNTDVEQLGATIGSHPAFPEGCNVGFAQIIDRGQIRLRVYERGGVGETRACGSGSCAAVSILRSHDLVDETVNVTQPGGRLIIKWTGGGNPVIMTGPATHVFKGKFS
jgi:diaminopimelate epimerase